MNSKSGATAALPYGSANRSIISALVGNVFLRGPLALRTAGGFVAAMVVFGHAWHHGQGTHDDMMMTLLPEIMPEIMREATHAEPHSSKATLAAVAILVLAMPGQARVTRLVVEHTETLGHDGYQKLTGHVYGELDPKLPLNAIITDLEFAPRNARGMVEYVATFTIVKPADMAKASGVLLYFVPNRGRINLTGRWIPRRRPKTGPRAGRQRLARRP